MQVIRVDNVNGALPAGLRLLHEKGDRRDSRNGGVVVSPEPVTTVYARPCQRVIFDQTRDANPFFHLFESLWMLAGRNDLAFVEKFAKNMRSYSDDGETMWGAYGWRWRSFFEMDQIEWAIKRLADNPLDRRVVVQMWSVGPDNFRADTGGKDVPCNLAIHFQVNPEKQLDMTVFNRSNDIIWGAYGANAVHMSILQEYVACSLGLKVGRYWQVSDNYHAYSDLYDKLLPVGLAWNEFDDPYVADVEAFPLMSGGTRDVWDQDLIMFMEEPAAVGFRCGFFRKIAKPMFMAHKAYKDGDFDAAREILDQMPDGNDWKLACQQWIDRREANKRRAQDDGVNYE